MTTSTTTDTKTFTDNPVWDLAFRPFFLLASISSIISLAIWIATLNGVVVRVEFSGLPINLWHAHEMTFGFGGAVAIGFLLTAVQTWTGNRSAHGSHLMLLTVFWIAARIAFLIMPENWVWISIALQIAWWYLAIITLAKLILSTNNKRNYVILPLISAIATVNFFVLWFAANHKVLLATQFSHATVLLFCVLISVIGGRVIPFFTQRKIESITIQKTPILDKAIPLLTLVNIGVFLSPVSKTQVAVPAALLITVGLLHLVRLFFWQPLKTVKIPLLWSLHLSYTFLGLGLITLGVSYISDSIRFNDALHLITIGTIGAMILSMMSRVSLGHTGRPMTVNFTMTLAFVLIFASAIVRFLLPIFNELITSWNLSAGLWILAFTLFLVKYTTVLIHPKLSTN
ncbi:NnrS family protein [Sessilibacter corallicola]|uniref:NnrS family protein n=1 Tax=Sessilibacter corallicola TaxID=2904075 RepID=UPI001E3C2D99|nr:NnrS family protein [Sessilibacter corallicola]MCE2029799.1 NnrS family protein [Sessilibacter corallicola]